jgi:hypothetical protein
MRAIISKVSTEPNSTRPNPAKKMLISLDIPTTNEEIKSKYRTQYRRCKRMMADFS